MKESHHFIIRVDIEIFRFLCQLNETLGNGKR